MKKDNHTDLPIYYFRHFRDRLKERYGITIVMKEYLELCSVRIRLLYKISNNKAFGILNIHGVDVWVIKCNRSKLLNTCLTRKGDLPVPLDYKKSGVTKEQFRHDLKKAIYLVHFLKKYYIESGLTKEEMFINKPFNLPRWTYGAACYLVDKKAVDPLVNKSTGVLVRNMYNPIEEIN